MCDLGNFENMNIDVVVGRVECFFFFFFGKRVRIGRLIFNDDADNERRTDLGSRRTHRRRGLSSPSALQSTTTSRSRGRKSPVGGLPYTLSLCSSSGFGCRGESYYFSFFRRVRWHDDHPHSTIRSPDEKKKTKNGARFRLCGINTRKAKVPRPARRITETIRWSLIYSSNIM